MIEAELAFLQVQVEGRLGQAIELGQTAFGEAPEAFDAIDVVVAFGEMIAAVANAPVLGVSPGRPVRRSWTGNRTRFRSPSEYAHELRPAASRFCNWARSGCRRAGRV